MLRYLIRYFKGYLRIRVSGNAIERFLNTCSYKGIRTWEIVSENNHYELNIAVKDFKKLKPVIRKTKTKLIIVSRSGFPFFIQKFKHRKVFFTGFFLFIITILYLSTYIWKVEIIGNKLYSTESILTFLESMDITQGMKTKKVNCSAISGKIRQEYEDIIWVSTSVVGTKLMIQIKENEDSKILINTQQTNEPYDIVSDGKYQISRIVVRKGIAYVKEKDFVKGGDLLVSGCVPVYSDSKELINYQYYNSDADIYGITTIAYDDEISYSTYIKDYFNIKKSQYYIKIGKYRFELGDINNSYESFEEYSEQFFFHNISFGIRSVYPYKKIPKKYTFNEIRDILSADFEYYCQDLKKKGVVILKNNVKIYTWSDKAKATGILTVEMPIGRKRKSELIFTGDHIDGNDGNNN